MLIKLYFSFLNSFKHFFFTYLGLYDFRRLSKKKFEAGRSAGSPQSGYSLAQLSRFGFRVAKHFLFCLIRDYIELSKKTLRAGRLAGRPLYLIKQKWLLQILIEKAQTYIWVSVDTTFSSSDLTQLSFSATLLPSLLPLE
jgi:hypothetical protein